MKIIRWSAAVVAATLLLPPGAAVAAPGHIVKVSVAHDGGPADGDSGAGTEMGLSISADGRFVAFTSYATNLVPGDTNGHRDVFVRDLRQGRTVRVSVGPGGEQGDGESREASISADGRYVAFSSFASTFAAGDTNDTYDVFVRDLRRGTTRLVSSVPGGGPGNLYSFAPDISANGQHVAFQSYASDLVTGDTNDGSDIFVSDLATGTNERVSVDSNGAQTNGSAQRPSISADGRRVVFVGGYLLPSDPPEGFYTSAYLHDRTRGTTVSMTVPLQDDPDHVVASAYPSISDDGRFVAFHYVVWLAMGGEAVPNAYLYDVRRARLRLISADPQGRPSEAIGPVHRLDLTPDGRYVSFNSIGRLTRDDRDELSDVYRWDRRTGRLLRITPGQTEGYPGSLGPVISADGRRIAFDSDAAGLAPGPRTGFVEVYLWTSG